MIEQDLALDVGDAKQAFTGAGERLRHAVGLHQIELAFAGLGIHEGKGSVGISMACQAARGQKGRHFPGMGKVLPLGADQQVMPGQKLHMRMRARRQLKGNQDVVGHQ